ncbi:hypothetical protein ACQP3C_31035 [Escherichia coli]
MCHSSEWSWIGKREALSQKEIKKLKYRKIEKENIYKNRKKRKIEQ